MNLDLWGYGGFQLIIWTGLSFGLLHTLMPCEDKFIFCFYAFGVARDWKQGLRIVNFYGLGLFLMNFIIGGLFTFFGDLLGRIINIPRFTWNGIASFTLIASGIVMLIQIRKKTYFPHGDQLTDLTENLSALKKRKRTSFLLGMLAGLPPCIFEMAIYLQAVTFSVQYGWGNGMWVIFFFGIGTWLGLYPLSLLGTMSGNISKALRSSRIQQIQAKFSFNRWRKEKSKGKNQDQIDETDNDMINTSDNLASEVKFNPQPSKGSIYSRIEYFSAWALILFGALFLVLAILGIDLFPFDITPPDPTDVTQNIPEDNFFIRLWLL